MYEKDNKYTLSNKSIEYEIYEKLNLLINDKELIDAYAEKSWQYGKKSFDIKDIQELLLESMEK